MRRALRVVALTVATCLLVQAAPAASGRKSVVCRNPGAGRQRVFLPDCEAYTIQATTFSSTASVAIGSGLVGGVTVSQAKSQQVVQLAEQMDQWNIQLNASMRLVCDMIRMHPCDTELARRLTDKQLEYSEKTAQWRMSVLAAASGASDVPTMSIALEAPAPDDPVGAAMGDGPEDIGEASGAEGEDDEHQEGRNREHKDDPERPTDPVQQFPRFSQILAPPPNAPPLDASAAAMQATAAAWAAEDAALLAKYSRPDKPKPTEQNVAF